MNANPFSLAGKRVLVTGASSGIGRAAAIECARAGAELLITGRDEERLLATLQALDGGPHRAVTADLTDPEGIERLVDEARGLDGVVHSAGIACSRPFPFVGRKVLDGVMEINFYAPAELTRRLLRASAVRARRIAGLCLVGGRTRVLGSGRVGLCRLEGGLERLARGMAIDLAPKGIRVNCVCPGVVETALFDAGTVTSEQLEARRPGLPAAALRTSRGDRLGDRLPALGRECLDDRHRPEDRRRTDSHLNPNDLWLSLPTTTSGSAPWRRVFPPEGSPMRIWAT